MRLIYSLFSWVSLSIFQGTFILFCLTETKQKKCWGSWHYSVVLQCCSYEKKTVKEANISVGFFCGKLWDLLEMCCQHIKYPVVFHDISYWIGFAAAGGDVSRERLWPCQWSRLDKKGYRGGDKCVVNQYFSSFLLCFSCYIN